MGGNSPVFDFQRSFGGNFRLFSKFDPLDGRQVFIILPSEKTKQDTETYGEITLLTQV